MSDDRVLDQLYAWLEEAIKLRHGPDAAGNILYVPDYAEGPAAFVEQLIQARMRADRVEELLSQTKRVRRKLQGIRQDAADTAADKLDQSLAEGAASAREYSLGVERKAEANLKSFAEKRAERQAQRRVDAADEVVEAINDAHWGLSGWRNDMRDIVRSFQLESNLER